MKHGPLSLRELEDQFVPILRNCISIPELKKIHAYIVKFSLSQSNYLVTKMIDICDSLGQTHYANLLFHQTTKPNIFVYNAILRTRSHSHFLTQTITIYKHLLLKIDVFPDKFTFPIVLKACAGLLRLDISKQIHGHVFKYGLISNPVVKNSLIDMYNKCEDIVNAHQVFDEMTDRDVISWNTMISGHARLGKMKKARAMFDSMPDKSIVSWTTLISGYTRIGCYAEALDVFHRMQVEGLMKPDEISIVSVLPSCAHLGALELGKWIHMYCDKNGLLRKTCVCNALIETYSKCGSIDQAWKLFREMSERDVISWSSMIVGLANHGKAREAIELFTEMERGQVEPNSITFLGLLSACSHAGFLREGLQYFNSMRNEYLIEPGVEHYGCVVDLLGRWGCLDQAVDFIEKMPMSPDASIWGCLLSACRAHQNLKIAVIAMEHLLELEPDDTGNYVLLTNIYAELGKWDGVSQMRKLMRSKRMKKTPGCSLIEVNNVVQEFVVGDDSYPLSDEIYSMLELLALQLPECFTISKPPRSSSIQFSFSVNPNNQSFSLDQISSKINQNLQRTKSKIVGCQKRNPTATPARNRSKPKPSEIHPNLLCKIETHTERGASDSEL